MQIKKQRKFKILQIFLSNLENIKITRIFKVVN